MDEGRSEERSLPMRPFILAVILATAVIVLLTSAVSADGNGSPSDCEGGPSTAGDPVATYDAGEGNIVNGVCIKSGANMFDGNKHSEVLGNGTYEDGCYDVDGVGTQVVSVTRLLSGNTCQAISHIDLILGTCGAECNPQCQENCDPCGQECQEPCEGRELSPECTADPCDDEDPPAECDPLVEVCSEGELIEVPQSQAPDSTDDCETTTICVDGNFVNVGDDTKATDDCGPVRLCADGESITVTRFEAKNDPDLQNADSGSCSPSETPPPSTPVPSSTPAIEELQEVQAVQDVAPVADVAALPSAGYGSVDYGTSGTWLIAISALLVGLSGFAAFAAYAQKP